MSKREIRLSVLELEKLGVTITFPQYPDTKAKENSRRLTACWNACEGISTENLEDNLPVKELADRYNAVLKQRDELLAVLEAVQAVANESSGIAGWHLNGDVASWDDLLPEVAEAIERSAIANNGRFAQY